jgi:hypothetical protein
MRSLLRCDADRLAVLAGPALHFCDLAHGQFERSAMALMFAAYFDASGKPTDAGRRVHCASLEAAWKAVLKRYTIPTPFHMADFNGTQGIYKSRRAWPRRTERTPPARSRASLRATPSGWC